MQQPQEARPRARSPFTAAFLSLLFPGLGHLYAGAPMRALGFAAPPILLLALIGGFVLRLDTFELIGAFVQLVGAIFVFNLVALVYRLVAIVDAYRVAEYLNAHAASGDGRLGRARLPRNPLSIAGLAAVVLVMAGSHVVVARYDLLAQDALGSCIFVNQSNEAECDPEASPTVEPSGPTNDSPEPTESSTPEPTFTGTAVPSVEVPPWDGRERLNILLIGSDEQRGGHNTDTLITVSIDPVTKQVAMFSLPRDTVDVPVPPGDAQRVWGRNYRAKINAWFVENRRRRDLWPGNDRQRGYNALKAIMGELYDLKIRYFVEVNFEGFKKVVDSVGGVTINVQVPVVDDQFPGTTGRVQRLYIPSGLQHMDGDQALRYARSRHTSTDFDRGARQQRVLLSLREQADPQTLIPRLPELVAALKSAVRTDVPIDQLDELLGLASQVDTANIRSFVFAPPLYSRDTCQDARGCVVIPNISRIKQAVKNAFSGDPRDEALRQTLAAEGARVWVLNGTNTANRGARLAAYLEYHGLDASAPRGKPKGSVPAKTVITVYNGAEADLAATVTYLEALFKVKIKTANDPAVAADVVVTIGRTTPELEPPPSS
ncbi:MAG TPA: LCP family protein [Candidatus Limnocylindrales bacterium]|jgi:polyisoprenyl-teichoic acid--peptidoglycan teichoic acid transferase|nr:LCP family protein [Candidatus Limnocylindrales bacterium]